MMRVMIPTTRETGYFVSGIFTWPERLINFWSSNIVSFELFERLEPFIDAFDLVTKSFYFGYIDSKKIIMS